MKKPFRIGLLPRILIAIVLGIVIGQVLPLWLVRVFETFNGIFSQFLGFCIPFIIVGLVTVAIADIGRGAGRMLLITVLIAYGCTLVAGLLSYATGQTFFPKLITPGIPLEEISEGQGIAPYFTVTIPPLMDVMTALVMAFVLGLGAATLETDYLKNVARDFQQIIVKTISSVILPLLPLYIFGIFLNMTSSGQVFGILMVFMPTVSTFAISEFLTNNKIKLFGTIIQENINSSMWNYGAALSFIMLIIIGITTLLTGSGEEDAKAEGGLI